jgi:hypothetical protein
VNRGLSGSGFHLPAPASGVVDVAAAEAGAAVIVPRAAAPAPASPAVHRKVRLLGAFDDWEGELLASARHIDISLQTMQIGCY